MEILALAVGFICLPFALLIGGIMKLFGFSGFGSSSESTDTSCSGDSGGDYSSDSGGRDD